jgi:hypothetical protein
MNVTAAILGARAFLRGLRDDRLFNVPPRKEDATAIEIVAGEPEYHLREMFETAAEQRDRGDCEYNARLGNKLIRILQNNQ